MKLTNKPGVVNTEQVQRRTLQNVNEAAPEQKVTETFIESRFDQAGGFPDLENFDALWSAGLWSDGVALIGRQIGSLKEVKVNQLDPDALAGLIHELHIKQHQLIGLANKLSLPQDTAAKLAALNLLHHLGSIQTEAAEMAFATADKREPERAVGAWIVHKNTRKTQGPSTRSERLEYFAGKARKFIKKGGSLSQIKDVTVDELKKFDSGRLIEWAVDEYDTPRMADAEGKPTPGHTLLAMGNDALSAGSMRVYKDNAGELAQVVIGTFSGHFRAGPNTLSHMARHLIAAGVPPERIVIQGGEAGTARALEVLRRSAGVDGETAQREQNELNAEAARYNPYAVQVASPPKEAHEVKEVETKGYRPQSDAGEVMIALEDMRQMSAQALSDGVVLESLGEATKLAESIQKVLSFAEVAGNPVAFQQAQALLSYFMTEATLDKKSKAVLEEVHARWGDHTFGTGAADPADVFSARPPDGRRTRVVATINPKATEVQLREMLTSGLDVARFNPAHSSLDELKAAIKRVRTVASSLGKEISIQVDLPGPKIRLGKFENPDNLEYNDIFLTDGQKVEISNAPGLGTKTRLPIELESLGKDVAVGDRFFMNDGLVELKATNVRTDKKGHYIVDAEVVTGGKIWDRKGVNMPDSNLSLPTITESDLKVLDAIAGDIDLLALSFVRDVSCLLQGREELQKRGVDIPIIAKIERPEAVENLEAIAHLSDGMMVARGDLGVEIGRAKVPFVERQIHKLGNQLGKPTMTATEVLMSMAQGAGRATRGDIEGLYAAVHDHGADAVMLGKETSYPDHPGRVVTEAVMTISRAEDDLNERPLRRIASGEASTMSPMATRFGS